MGLLSGLCALPVFAQDEASDEETKEILEGHSYHGGAFNEGPRQAAYLMGDTGKVEFDITTDSSKAKKFFLQGIGQLHGFWYFEAERSFRQVAAIDPDCAIAYWGMAMANIDNEKRARGFLAEAIKRQESATERERMYISSFATALGIPDKLEELEKIKDLAEYKPKRAIKDRRQDYVKKLEELSLAYPDDIEAKAFIVTMLWQNGKKGIKLASTLTADALCQQIFDKNPMHQAHHYRIHIWDRRKASTALDSAAALGLTSPTIAHMWHMPGHIYDKEKRFADSAWHQEASARTDHRHMIADRVMPDQIHNYAHNNEWLTRSLMHVGRIPEALDLAKNMTELPRHPKFNTLKKGSARYGRMRLRNLLIECELWEEARELTAGPYLQPTDVHREQVYRLQLLGRACYGMKDIEAGDKIVAELGDLKKAIIKKADEDRKKKEAEAAKKKEEDAKAAKSDKAPAEKKSDKAEKEDTEYAEAKKPDSKKPTADKKAKPASKKRTPADATFVDSVVKELKLAKAVAQGSAKDVLEEEGFKTTGISKTLLLDAYLQAHDHDKAIELTKGEVDRRKGQTLPLARHVYALHAAGKMDEAKAAFSDLRAISEDVALETPVFARLASVAEEFDAPADWRKKRKKPTDIRKRPKLEDLGPFRWHPSPAPSLVLADHNGDYTSLILERQEEDVLLIFYLGAECLHCVEQLGAFGPMVEKYKKAGITIIGVSPESREGLRQSLLDYAAGGIEDFGKGSQESLDKSASLKDFKSPFPFMILADPSLETFKEFRAYDDFENTELHGTFLVDKEGYIRWQDISYEPFMDAEWLLKESQRLLAQPDAVVHGPREKPSKRFRLFKPRS